MGGRRRRRRPLGGQRHPRRGDGQLTGTEPPDELVGDAADELYGLPPEEFTAARDERVRAARAAGDRPLGAALTRLRRPTVSAWVLNLLLRDQPEIGDQLVALGAELRRAQAELSGPELRELAAQRQRLVSALVRSARRIAAREGHPVTAAAAFEVEQTLHAALADPEVAAEVSSGRLVRPVSRTGFDGEGGSGLAAPERPAPRRPERRLRAVRDDEVPAEDPAVARERRRREEERERLRTELAAAEEARADAERAYEQAEQRLGEAERQRAETAELVEDLSRRLAEAEDAARDAGRAERDAQRLRDSAERRRDAATRRTADLAARLAELD